jgi:predicted nuclease of predicted toxin-antitoxin system
MKDTDVLALAQAQDRVLLTCDKDFGEMVFRSSMEAESGAILFRFRSGNLAQFTTEVLRAISRPIHWAGQFGVVTPKRVRLRSLPKRI